nr:glycosyltransferase [Herbaspirillum sp. ASV7]
MKRVAICVPSGDMVHADFAMALAAMCYRCGPFIQDDVRYEAVPLAVINTKGSMIANNRNRLVEEARALGVDYMFFLDSDIVVHPYTLRRLLDLDKDIVGGTYVQRDVPHRLLGKSVSGVMLDEAMQGMAVDQSEAMEVGALPGGCLLIKMSVFDDLQQPYFQTPTHAAEDGRHAWIEGEDYFFCRTAREAGHQVFVDWATSFALGHVGQQVNTIQATQQPANQREAENAIVH